MATEVVETGISLLNSNHRSCDASSVEARTSMRLGEIESSSKEIEEVTRTLYPAVLISSIHEAPGLLQKWLNDHSLSRNLQVWEGSDMCL